MSDIRGCWKGVSVALGVVLLMGGCGKSGTPAQQQASPQQASSAAGPNQAGSQAMNPEGAAGQMPPAPAAEQRPQASAVIPAGTRVVVSLGETLSSKTAQAGESFQATVAQPVRVDGVVLIRAGAPATGTVTDAKALGHFKGGAELALRLDTVRAEGHTYRVASSTIERVEKGKGRRTAILPGGGTGLGALIGGLAGGGRGALIGGFSGAGAGAAGSAFTGNKELVIPVETNLTFRLERNVALE